ncbi:MAG: hypothetical protein LBO06_04805 [Bacteroidales bacterium]|jgi:hypothetical protein|nr:hypothetical protein [Bacteroidales bacterium]
MTSKLGLDLEKVKYAFIITFVTLCFCNNSVFSQEINNDSLYLETFTDTPQEVDGLGYYYLYISPQTHPNLPDTLYMTWDIFNNLVGNNKYFIIASPVYDSAGFIKLNGKMIKLLNTYCSEDWQKQIYKNDTITLTITITKKIKGESELYDERPDLFGWEHVYVEGIAVLEIKKKKITQLFFGMLG